MPLSEPGLTWKPVLWFDLDASAISHTFIQVRIQEMAVQTRGVQAAISENRTWFTILGVLLIILGVAAIAFPLLTTIAAKIALGWLFLIGGVVQIAHAFSTRQWSEFFSIF
jgi:uncharacterized membrane protein HdeD (DUF308 family)